MTDGNAKQDCEPILGSFQGIHTQSHGIINANYCGTSSSLPFLGTDPIGTLQIAIVVPLNCQGVALDDGIFEGAAN